MLTRKIPCEGIIHAIAPCHHGRALLRYGLRAAVVLALNLETAFTSPLLYTVKDLGVLSGHTLSFGLTLNNRGQVAGGNGFTVTTAFRYTDGVGMQDLGVLPGHAQSLGWGINDLGQVTGFSYASQSSSAFRYTDGVGMQDLGVLPGSPGSSGAAINSRGQVVGYSYPRAFRYTDGIGMEDLGVTPGNPRVPMGINAVGDLVFTVQFFDSNGESVDRPLVYTDALGRFVDVNTLIPKASGWVLTTSFDINDFGQITGSGLLNGNERAVLLTPTTVVPEPGTAAMLAVGSLAVVGLVRWRKR